MYNSSSSTYCMCTSKQLDFAMVALGFQKPGHHGHSHVQGRHVQGRHDVSQSQSAIDVLGDNGTVNKNFLPYH